MNNTPAAPVSPVQPMYVTIAGSVREVTPQEAVARLEAAARHVEKLSMGWQLRDDLLAILAGTGEDIRPSEGEDG